MKRFVFCFAFAFSFLLITKLDTNAYEGVYNNPYSGESIQVSVPSSAYVYRVNDNNGTKVVFVSKNPFTYVFRSNRSAQHYTNVYQGSNIDCYIADLGVMYDYFNPNSDIPYFNGYTNDLYLYISNLASYNDTYNLNTTDYFKVSPFRLLAKDYIYYEFDIKSKTSLVGGQALVQVLGDRGTWEHRHYGIFSNQSGTVSIDDYVSVNSVFYVTLTPIGSDNDYGQSIIYKYRLTQDGIISVYDEPIDTPKALNVDINNNYIPVTQINKNRAFVSNINYSTITYNSMNVEYSNTWDIYYSPNISISNDNISIQNITDSFNSYNYVTNNYNDLTYGLGLNFDFGDNDISNDGNVIDTLDDIKVLLSFLPWLLGLFTFIPGSFVTIVLGGFAIILVVVIVKIFK